MGRFFLRASLIFLVVIAGARGISSAAEETTAFSISAVSTKTPPAIDGTLNDPAWKTAAHAQLGWDISYLRPASEETDAYLLVDSKYLYVAFSVKQKEPVTATQHTNDQPLPNDDVVRVYFWPSGDSGIEYGFVSNPIGTRYEFSTENASFAPAWLSVAKPTTDGYVVTERIPLDVMRSDGRSTWRVQFDRRLHASSQVFEWSHHPAQGGSDSSLYAGYLQGMKVAASGARTRPRLGIYALGQYASTAAGGSTSRMGADLSVPLTQTSSFVATFHPDYSNVELDQQSISPTAFPRQFSEVRPFFTQGQFYYNNFNCNDCVDFPLLYTPSIPTPRSGYAVEGKQGSFTFGAFDAVGIQRNDAAQSVNWLSHDHRYRALYQRVAVDIPGLHDVAQYAQGTAGNGHNFSGYATVGGERGTLVSDPGKARYAEYGINFYNQKSGIFAAWHDVGPQYGPVDAFNQISDVHGPTLSLYREYDNRPTSYIQNWTAGADFARMRDSSGALNDAWDSWWFHINTRNKMSLQFGAGDNFLNFGPGAAGETNENGASLTFGSGSSTSKSIGYFFGRFGAGYLHVTRLSSSFALTPRATLTLQAFQNNQILDAGGRNVQWLERASIGFQAGPGESYAAGWRRIVGKGPTFFSHAQDLNGTNFSFAYYKRLPMFELYFAYGNPNRLNTQHDLILKLIQYFGAEKGT